MIIYLVGYMGCGKSTLGKKLASLIKSPFYDLDAVVEQQTGMSISEIFDTLGETGFREIESQCLRNIPTGISTVISCGGGTPCYGNNMDYMNQSGLTIYIKIPADIIANRLFHSENKRPLLPYQSREILKDHVVRMMEQREMYYSRARLAVEGINLNPNDLLQFINMHSVNR
jgi:shikimate kinase